MKKFFEDIRSRDRDSFICTLLAPAWHHEHVCHIYALNVELTNIVYQFSDSMIALIKLRWWREKIEAIYDGHCVGHNGDNIEIITGLAKIIHQFKIPASLIENYFDGFELIVLTETYNEITDLENVAQKTTVSMIEMLCIILHGEDEVYKEFAYHTGISWNLMNNLRNERYIHKRNASFLPMLLSSGLQISSLTKKDMQPLVREIVKIIIERIESHIDQAKSIAKDLPKSLRNLSSRFILADLHIQRIRAKNFDIFHNSIGPISVTMQIKLLANYFIRWVCNR